MISYDMPKAAQMMVFLVLDEGFLAEYEWLYLQQQMMQDIHIVCQISLPNTSRGDWETLPMELKTKRFPIRDFLCCVWLNSSTPFSESGYDERLERWLPHHQKITQHAVGILSPKNNPHTALSMGSPSLLPNFFQISGDGLCTFFTILH